MFANISKTNLGAVTDSVELRRILALPRRVIDLDHVEDVTPLFRKPGGTMRFWPIQSAALIEASLANGLFAPIGVGHGKTLVTLALPTAMGSDRAVLLVPAQLKAQLLEKLLPQYLQHFDLPIARLHIVAYEELSSANRADVLDEIDPDLVIADEAHLLRHRSAARTKRFIRFFQAHPECRFAALSGNLTTRSLTDYAHLIEIALRKNSPIPLGYHELQDWAGAIDVKPERPLAPGALLQFCRPDESVRSGFRRRLIETTGVVATSEGSLGTSLVIRRLSLPLPPGLDGVRQHLLKHWTIGEGNAKEELTDVLAIHRVLRQLATGFYYRRVWPRGEVDYDWLEAQRAWAREVRTYLAHAARPGMDSEYLVECAAREGRWAARSWAAWAQQEHKPEPPREAVWIDAFMVEAAVRWAAEADGLGSIIWVEHTALGEAISTAGGFPYYDEGDSTFATAKVIVCSVKSQTLGKNLQDRYSRNLITTPPANGTTWEQLTGRTHRNGQEADVVTADWYGHVPDMVAAYEAAIEDAHYQEETLGAQQKLLYATRID